MSYLSDTLHDIFISYAHTDNVPDREGERGWVEQFEQQLTVGLLKRSGETVDVWRDLRLERAQVFDDVIEQAVRNSAIQLALITNSYLKSSYCQQELEWFQEKAKAEPRGLVVQGYMRVIPVLLYDFPPSKWPAVCQGASPAKFFDSTGKPFAPSDNEFRDRLHDLIESIYRVLELMRSSAINHATTPAKPFRVFLAHTADDQRPTQRRIASALVRERIDVASGIPPPYEAPDHDQAVRAAIEGADLSVHLLGTNAGESVEEAEPEKTYPLEQVRVATDHAQSQLVMLPEEFDLSLVKDEAYARSLESLLDRERETARFEIVQTDRQRMLGEILDKRRRLEEAEQGEQAAEVHQETAFVDLHMADLPQSADLVGYLTKRRIKCLMVPSADDVPKMTTFEEHLNKAKLFIVFFGSVAREWVEQRLIEASKLILVNGLATKIGVYVAPPRKPSEQISFPYHVALNVERFDPATLEPLLGDAAASAP